MSSVPHWDTRYQTGDTPWDSGRPSAELIRVVAEEKISPCRAVEFGCGTGTNAIWLSQQGFDVTAIDLSPLAIQRAKANAAAAGANGQFLAGDLLAPPDLGGPFNFVFDRGCYHIVRLTSVEGYLNTFDQALAVGGYGLLLTGNANEKLEKGPPAVQESEIRNEMGRRFTIVWLREFRFDSEISAGLYPLGWSCLVRKEMK